MADTLGVVAVKELFSSVDSDGDGHISLPEFAVLLRSLGWSLSRVEEITRDARVETMAADGLDLHAVIHMLQRNLTSDMMPVEEGHVSDELLASDDSDDYSECEVDEEEEVECEDEEEEDLVTDVDVCLTQRDVEDLATFTFPESEEADLRHAPPPSRSSTRMGMTRLAGKATPLEFERRAYTPLSVTSPAPHMAPNGVRVERAASRLSSVGSSRAPTPSLHSRPPPLPAKLLAKLRQDTATLSHHHLTDATAASIAGALDTPDLHLQLRVLNLSHNFIGTSGICRLLPSICSHDSLISLDLSCNHVGQKASHLSGYGCGPAFYHLLKANRSLRELTLASNKMSDADVRSIFEGLCENFSLHSLNLWDNDLTAQSGEYIKQMLGTNGDLRELNLGWNKLANKGTMLVLEGLRQNNVLKKINLSWNGITDKGGVMIGQVIHGNTSLEEVDVSHNRIGKEGALKIAEGLTQNGVVKTLSLAHNPLTDGGVTGIIKALRENVAMERVDMQSCQSGDTANEELSETIKRRRNQLTIVFSFSSLPNPDLGSAASKKQPKLQAAARMVLAAGRLKSA